MSDSITRLSDTLGMLADTMDRTGRKLLALGVGANEAEIIEALSELVPALDTMQEVMASMLAKHSTKH